MKKAGRTASPLTKEEKAIVIEYLTGDLSQQEVADKYGITKGVLRYKLAKYRKENENGKEKSN